MVRTVRKVLPGTNGVDGAQGLPGTNGVDGAQGIQGFGY